MTVSDQIIADLTSALADWRGLLGTEVLEVCERRIRDRAPVWAAQLASDDDRLAAETVLDLMAALDDRPDYWWATPLGRLVARSTGSPLGETVSYSVAAGMLGISRTRCQQLVESGRLSTGAGGSIDTMSVLDELVRRD